MLIPLRADFDVSQLHKIARNGGVTLQIVRDCVMKFNVHGVLTASSTKRRRPGSKAQQRLVK